MVLCNLGESKRERAVCSKWWRDLKWPETSPLMMIVSVEISSRHSCQTPSFWARKRGGSGRGERGSSFGTIIVEFGHRTATNLLLKVVASSEREREREERKSLEGGLTCVRMRQRSWIFRVSLTNFKISFTSFRFSDLYMFVTTRNWACSLSPNSYRRARR